MKYKIIFLKKTNIFNIKKILKINIKDFLNWKIIDYFFPLNIKYNNNLYNFYIKKFIKIFLKKKYINIIKIWNKCINNINIYKLYFTYDQIFLFLKKIKLENYSKKKKIFIILITNKIFKYFYYKLIKYYFLYKKNNNITIFFLIENIFFIDKRILFISKKYFLKKKKKKKKKYIFFLKKFYDIFFIKKILNLNILKKIVFLKKLYKLLLFDKKILFFYKKNVKILLLIINSLRLILSTKYSNHYKLLIFKYFIIKIIYYL